jgi:hypothetical protein
MTVPDRIAALRRGAEACRFLVLPKGARVAFQPFMNPGGTDR